MTFIWPLMLLSLLTLPVFIGLYIRLLVRRRRMAATYGTLGFVQEAGGRPLGWRRHIPPVMFFIGLILLGLALGRPQTVLSLPRVIGTVILAFDVSGSMAAEDMQPTRMEAAKVAAREFVKQQPITVQVGVVAFSDAGLSVQPPTNDQDLILAAIDRLTPQRGTSLANGILASLQAIATAGGKEITRYYTNITPVPTLTPTPMPKGEYQPAAIVLLTDGENNVPPQPQVAAKEAADRGVRIYPIGIGSAAGTTLKVEGFMVHTRLDEATLQQIAQLTDGVYHNAQNEEELRAIYGSLGSQLVIKPERTEITSVLVASSLLFFLLGGVLSLLWFSRLP